MPVALACAALAAGGCGGGGGNGDPFKPGPTGTATPPPSDEIKQDLLTAAIQLDAYKLYEHRFTDIETELGPAFPLTVTIKEADETSFSMAAYDDKGVRYAYEREGDITERTCDPPTDDEVCPDGEW